MPDRTPSIQRQLKAAATVTQLSLMVILLTVTDDVTGQYPTTTTANPFNATGCPVGLAGYFPDPAGCTSYLECSIDSSGQTVSYRHQCNAAVNGPYFKPTVTGYGFCSSDSTLCQQLPQQPSRDIPQNSGGQVYNPTYNNNKQGQSQGTFTCPRFPIYGRTTADGLYGDPSNCFRYFLCQGGQATSLPCPDGMSWSESLKNCDFVYRSNCSLAQLQQQYRCLYNNGNTVFNSMTSGIRLIVHVTTSLLIAIGGTKLYS